MSTTFEHGGRVFALARELGLLPEELLDFSASINPLGPPAGVWPALEAAYRRVGHYPDTDCTELRSALATCSGLAPEQVCVGNGSTELIHLLPRLERFRERRALLLAPTFAEYAHALELAGWRYDRHLLRPGDGFALDPESVAARLTRGYDLLWLGNPGNPTGCLYRQEEVAGLLALCRERGVLLVVDEAFMDFCEEESALALLAGEGGLLILRSLTKFYGFPGLRLGCAWGAPAVIAGLERLRPPWSVGSLAQAAGLAALRDREYAVRTRELVAREQARLAAGLAALPGLTLYPGAANYLLVRWEEGQAAELQAQLLAERILIRDCGGFPGLDGRYFRVAVRSGGENDTLLAALGRLLG